MAKTNAADRIKATRNPFTGMTMAQMKKKWSSMTPKQREANHGNFVRAAKNAPKAKTPSSGGISQKPKTKPVPKAKPEGKTSASFERNYKTGKMVGKDVEPKPKKKISKGKENIRRMVEEQSGSSKRDKSTQQRRRQRAREDGLKKNRREYLSRKHNDM